MYKIGVLCPLVFSYLICTLFLSQSCDSEGCALLCTCFSHFYPCLPPFQYPLISPFFSHLRIFSLFSILAICFKLLSYCFPSLSLSRLECRRERERGGRGVKSHLGFYKKFKTNFQTGYFLLVIDTLYTTCVLGA